MREVQRWKQMVGRVVHTAERWIKQKRGKNIRTEMDLMKVRRKSNDMSNEMITCL